MKNSLTKKTLLILLASSFVLTGFLNISGFLVHHDLVSTTVLGKTNLTALLGQVSIVLFIYIILAGRYRKINLAWILIPYLGAVIFAGLKLFETPKRG